MSLHKDLTGAELHEPKGADSASSGQVYVSNGAGSGVWTDRYSGVYNLNKYQASDIMDDISTANSSAYLYVPVNSELKELACIIHGSLATANAVLSIYINGILFGESLTVTFSGSAKGDLSQLTVTTANTITPGSVVEIRSDGGSTNAVKCTIVGVFEAKA